MKQLFSIFFLLGFIFFGYRLGIDIYQMLLPSFFIGMAIGFIPNRHFKE